MLKICPHALSLEVKLELILIPCGRPEVLKLRFYWWIHKAYRELITTSVVFGIGYESPLSLLCFISFPPFFHSHPSLDGVAVETLISDQPLISIGCLTRNIFFLHFWEISVWGMHFYVCSFKRRLCHKELHFDFDILWKRAFIETNQFNANVANDQNNYDNN